jgi:serine phosphatase RsbU (regulator of sigma subunit)
MYRGGDLFDSYVRPDGSCALLIADASSKGPLSIVHTEIMRRTFRLIASVERSPAQMLETLNALRFGSPPPYASVTFASALIVAIEPRSATCRYASAGHDIGIIARGRAHQHLESTGPVLGIFDDAEYGEHVETFVHGDLLLVATDGFTECRDVSNRSRQFGTSGLVRALASDMAATCRAISQTVVRSADTFTGGRYRDDATLAVIARSSAA